MEDLTMQLIYAVKRRPHNEETLEEEVISFMSDYTGTPKQYYNRNTVFLIVKDAFIDFLKTADNPSFIVWQYFDVKTRHPDDITAILITFELLQVRDKDGYVNGFREHLTA